VIASGSFISAATSKPSICPCPAQDARARAHTHMRTHPPHVHAHIEQQKETASPLWDREIPFSPAHRRLPAQFRNRIVPDPTAEPCVLRVSVRRKRSPLQVRRVQQGGATRPAAPANARSKQTNTTNALQRRARRSVARLLKHEARTCRGVRPLAAARETAERPCRAVPAGTSATQAQRTHLGGGLGLLQAARAVREICGTDLPALQVATAGQRRRQREHPHAATLGCPRLGAAGCAQWVVWSYGPGYLSRVHPRALNEC
jgi:hypothetical protein